MLDLDAAALPAAPVCLTLRDWRNAAIAGAHADTNTGQRATPLSGATSSRG